MFPTFEEWLNDKKNIIENFDNKTEDELKNLYEEDYDAYCWNLEAGD